MPADTLSSVSRRRLKAGCSQDWLPHNLGGMVSRIKKYAALGTPACRVGTHADAYFRHCRHECLRHIVCPRTGIRQKLWGRLATCGGLVTRRNPL